MMHATSRYAPLSISASLVKPGRRAGNKPAGASSFSPGSNRSLSLTLFLLYAANTPTAPKCRWPMAMAARAAGMVTCSPPVVLTMTH